METGNFIVWVLLASLLLLNIALRLENKTLKSQLLLKRDPNEPLAFLQDQRVQNKSKIDAIKALRKQFPELSLVDATQLWQSLDSSNIDKK